MMDYRRFGKTDLTISAFTLGTMRFLHGWDKPCEELPDDSLENCHDVVKTALDAGITLLETAKGYCKSEYLLGRILPTLDTPRDHYHIMTKSPPRETAGE
ncbi:MAG: aldo/keto reductase, partial [Magnetococcales bacterium]|nr:aldo/keto reductase [Magnetococcales bacterium]